MQTLQVAKSDEQYKPTIKLYEWDCPPGSSGEYVPDEEFIFYDESMMVRGDPQWPPSIVSYYGHFIPIPKVQITYVGRSAKFLKCLVTFLKKEWNDELKLLSWKPVFTVPAWQGDNNIIHLIEALPHETWQNVDMSNFLATAEEIDIDYLSRMRMLYPDEEITRLAPELFFYPDMAVTDK